MSYEIGGYEIGAPVLFQPARSLALSTPRTMPAPPSMGQAPGLPVRQIAPEVARLLPVGLNTAAAVAPAATGQAVTTPQQLFKPRRYVVMPSIAAAFTITSILIGVSPQSPANVAIAAESFLPNAQYSDVDWDTCQISQQIVANVTNTSPNAATFLSTLYGYVAR